MLAGTSPRERRSTSGPRSTESSARVSIGRSWTRKRSAMRAEALERLGVVEGDRLVGDVAARHHQRHAGVREQQVVQRRRRQHHAEVGLARRDGSRDGGAGTAAARSRSAARARSAARSSSGASTTSARAASRLGDHQRERLVLAVLARAQRRDGGLVVGAAGEVVAADSLDRHDRGRRAAPPPPRRPRRRRPPPRAAGPPLAVRSAGRAARTPGRRSARRGSGGRAGPRTPPCRPRRARSRPSSCARGRRGRRARS